MTKSQTKRKAVKWASLRWLPIDEGGHLKPILMIIFMWKLDVSMMLKQDFDQRKKNHGKENNNY